MTKEYTIIYKFSDVIETLKAKSKEHAKELADIKINSKKAELIKKDTYCYGIDVEDDND